MILQVLTDTGNVMHHGDAEVMQQGARPQARQLKDLRRADGSGGEQDLAARADDSRFGPAAA